MTKQKDKHPKDHCYGQPCDHDGKQLCALFPTRDEWEKKEMIDFLKHILPYWESDDLDDYMYIVHHYDVERVAEKFKQYISNNFISKAKLKGVIENHMDTTIIDYHECYDNTKKNQTLSELKKELCE